MLNPFFVTASTDPIWLIYGYLSTTQVSLYLYAVHVSLPRRPGTTFAKTKLTLTHISANVIVILL
jgi:hypothetical protein